MHGDVTPFDRVAPIYDRLLPRARADRILAGLAHADRPIERVVDVAGGPGRAIRALDVPERLVVDAAAGMTRRARRRGLAAVRGDAAALPLVDDSVDAVLIVDALHHVGDRDGALAEAARVLAPGGVLVIVEFDPATVRGWLLAAAEHAVGMDSRFDRPAELAERVARAGLVPTVVERGFTYVVAGVV